MPRSVLGRTGKSVSRLGIGCGIFSKDEFTAKEMIDVIETALARGVNYLDTAPNYPGVQNAIGPVVKANRDKLFLVSKIEETTAAGAWQQIRKSLADLQTDRLDLVHLHSFGDVDRWPDVKMVCGPTGALSALIEAREKGVIGAIGASGHNRPSRFHQILDTGAIDVLMNPANFVMQHIYDFEAKVWARARLSNVGLVAMKVLGGVYPGNNRESRLPLDEFENAIRYALSIPGVSTAVIGMRDFQQVEEAADVVCSITEPLDEAALQALYQRGIELMATAPGLWRPAWGPKE
jgi:aryl-alcohol dehydrogenase-like predicted oxidoreductase